MKFIRSILLVACLLSGGSVMANSLSDRDFDQDRMLMTTRGVIILSPFEIEDYLTSYNDRGEVTWNIFFSSKVMSWKIKDNRLYVLSKDRYQEKTYLHCFDAYSGNLMWQRP